MVSKKIKVRNQSGLHARPAGILAKAAGECKSEVKIIVEEKIIPAKNILKLMSAAIKCGTEIELQCDGESEQADLESLTALIEGGFGEEIVG